MQELQSVPDASKSCSLILSILYWNPLHLFSNSHGLVRRWNGDGMDSGKELPETPAKIIISKDPWQVDGRKEV